MQSLPQDELRKALSLAHTDEGIDQQTAVRLKKRMAEEFRQQLMLGAPSNEDEAGLRRLSAQIKAKKVVVKLFLRHPLHAKLYLVHRQDPNNPTVVEEGLALTAEFTADGQVSGFGGCNNYSGTYQAGTDGTMTIGPLAATAMACADTMDQETAYLTALQAATSFSFRSPGQLVINYGSDLKQVLVFAVGETPLVSTDWILISMGDAANPQRIPAGTVITADFSADGLLSGSGGCVVVARSAKHSTFEA
jgi:heat shock protein HslJ